MGRTDVFCLLEPVGHLQRAFWPACWLRGGRHLECPLGRASRGAVAGRAFGGGRRVTAVLCGRSHTRAGLPAACLAGFHAHGAWGSSHQLVVPCPLFLSLNLGRREPLGQESCSLAKLGSFSVSLLLFDLFPHTLSSSWLLSRGSNTHRHVTGEALGTHRLLQLDVFYKVSVSRVLAEALPLRSAKVEKARPCAEDRGVLLLSLLVGPRPVVFFTRTQFRPWAGLCPQPRTCVACAG